jgi:hypothetical protein
MASAIHILGWTVLASIFCGTQVRAQGSAPVMPEPREQPVAPSTAPLPAGSISPLALDANANIQGAADVRPLSGVQEQSPTPGLGVRNFLVPSLSVTSQMATSSSASGFSQPGVFNYVLGSLDVNHVSDRSELLLHYSGGGMFSSYLNSAIQDADFLYNIKRQRWSLVVGDDVNFLSASPFGFGGVGGLQYLNGASPFGPGGFLYPFLAPNQTIPTILVPRLSNTSVAQIEYKSGPRSSWTASGSYGTLNFLGIGYINSAQTLFQAGYNYLLSPQSTIAVIYRYDNFQFTHLPQTIGDQVVQLAYSRNVTGRLSFQLAAGPSIEMLRGPLTSYGNLYSWAVDGSLDYRLGRTALLVSYDHRVTGGSGVLAGAQTGQAEGTVQHTLSPRWQSSVSVGYATNGTLVPTTVALGQRYFDSWYTAARFSHQLRPGTDLFLSYGARLQATNAAGCGPANCVSHFISHEFSIGFNFSLRPRSFR